jgi:DNA-binding NtrC family response regulator
VRPIEREMILKAIDRNRGNFSKAAQDLGMSRRGLRLKIESLGIKITDRGDE